MSTEQLRELLDLLVDDPVEPRGILSRLEQHVTQLRDYLHGATRTGQPPDALAWQILLKTMHSIADHDAQISAARHEFLRDFLVQMDARLHRIESILYGTEARERAMTRLAELERRIKRLEHERHDDDDPAGGAGRETAAAQAYRQDGPGSDPDR